jgi:hypothetical protein
VEIYRGGVVVYAPAYVVLTGSLHDTSYTLCALLGLRRQTCKADRMAEIV